MNRISGAACAAFLLASGCMGMHGPKLTQCTGPYRYANARGTVLPSLAIPGRVPLATPAKATIGPVPVSGRTALPPGPPGSLAPVAPQRAIPDKTGAILPSDPGR
jgi:hypothetical protein